MHGQTKLGRYGSLSNGRVEESDLGQRREEQLESAGFFLRVKKQFDRVFLCLKCFVKCDSCGFLLVVMFGLVVLRTLFVFIAFTLRECFSCGFLLVSCDCLVCVALSLFSLAWLFFSILSNF